MNRLNIVIMVFIALTLVIISAYLWYEEARASGRHQLKRRLRSLAVDTSDRRFPTQLRLEILAEMTRLEKFLFSFKPVRKLDMLIDNAGYRFDVTTFMILTVLSALFVFAAGFFLITHTAFSLIFFPLGGTLPILYLYICKEKKIRTFIDELPEILDMLARSLRAGHSLSGALHLVSTEMPEPAAGLFKTAYEEQSLGLSMREALEHMTRRMPSPDLRFFVMAANIHREIGGNLAEILQRLARTIRERIKIRRQVRVYTAQARLTGYVLAAAPLTMAILLYVFMPGYIEELFTVKWGIYAVYLVIFMQIAGFVIIRRIIKVRV